MKTLILSFLLVLLLPFTLTADEWYEATATYLNSNASPILLKISSPRRALLEEKIGRFVRMVWGDVAPASLSIPSDSVTLVPKQYDPSSQTANTGYFYDVYAYCAKRNEVVQLLMVFNLDGLSQPEADEAVRSWLIGYATRRVWFAQAGKPNVGNADVRLLVYERATTSTQQGPVAERQPNRGGSGGYVPPDPPVFLQPFIFAPGTWFSLIGVRTFPNGNTDRKRYTIEAKYAEDIPAALKRVMSWWCDFTDPAAFAIEAGSVARIAPPPIYRTREGQRFYAFYSTLDEMRVMVFEVSFSGNFTDAQKLERAAESARGFLYPGNGIVASGESEHIPRVVHPPAPSLPPVFMDHQRQSTGTYYTLRTTYKKPDGSGAFKTFSVVAPSADSVLQTVAAVLADHPEYSSLDEFTPREAPETLGTRRVYQAGVGYTYRAYIDEGRQLAEYQFESAFAGAATAAARDAAALDLVRRWMQAGNGRYEADDTPVLLRLDLIESPQAAAPPAAPPAGAGSSTGGGVTRSAPAAGSTLNLASQKWSVVVEVSYSAVKKESKTVVVQAATEAKAMELALAEVKKQLGKTLYTGIKALKATKTQ